MSVTLTLRTLWSGTAAGNGDAVAVDYRAAENPVRNVMVNTMNSADTITVQGSMDNSTWYDIASHTGGAGPFSDLIVGPWVYLRVAKTGSTGNAVVMGIV